jgi:hypothetical protein
MICERVRRIDGPILRMSMNELDQVFVIQDDMNIIFNDSITPKLRDVSALSNVACDDIHLFSGYLLTPPQGI